MELCLHSGLFRIGVAKSKDIKLMTSLHEAAKYVHRFSFPMGGIDVSTYTLGPDKSGHRRSCHCLATLGNTLEEILVFTQVLLWHT
jgi:hypothetical protein